MSLVVADFAAHVSLGRVTLGWLSPVVVRDVVADDLHGERILELGSLQTVKSLGSLLASGRDFGVLRVENPRLQINLRPDGSNLEDALQPWLAAPSEETRSFACAVEITGGTIGASDASTGKKWQADGVQASIQVPQTKDAPLTVRLQANIMPEQGQTAELAAEVLWPCAPSQKTGDGSGRQFSLRTQSLPLDLIGAVMQRFSPGLRLGGSLSGEAQVDWSESLRSLRLDRVKVEQLELVAPTWLGTDRVAIASIESQGEVALRENSCQLQRLVFRSDVANFEANGTSALAQPTGRVEYGWFAQILRGADLKLRGDVNLAALASMLPSTLRIREGTQVTSGKVSLDVQLQGEADSHRWTGQLLVRDLVAVHQGRRIAWEHPVEVVLAAQRKADRVAIDQLACRSSFLTLTARGSLAEGAVTLQGDLSRFLAEASQFIDLGQLQLAGKLTADVHWCETGEGALSLEGQGLAERLELATPHRRPLHEDRLQVRLAATARFPGGSLQQLERATARFESAGDRLDLELLQPVNLAAAKHDWHLRLQAAGDLARWTPRLESFLPLTDWDIQGTTQVDLTGSVSSERFELASVRVDANELGVRYGRLRIHEPVVQLETAATWDWQQGDLNARSTTLASGSLALRSDALRMQTKGGKFSLDGNAAYRLQLERVLGWLNDPQQPWTQKVSGEATGQMQFRHAAGATTAQWTADVQPFAYARRASAAGTQLAPASLAESWQVVWQEPQLTLSGEADYDPAAGVLRIAKLQAAGTSLSLGAEGRVTELPTRCLVDVSGQIAYDLERLAARFDPAISQRLRLVGRDVCPFSLQGPLFASEAGTQVVREASARVAAGDTAASHSALDEMTGTASVAWQSASVEGFAIGPGALQAQLARGVVSVVPLDLAVSDGRIRLAPQLVLNRTPAMLVLPQGPVAEQVRLSPEMCRGWLKYVAPLIADATAAEGRFSLSLDAAAIPVSEPSRGDVEGTLSVESARIGPGPLSHELLVLTEQIKALVERRAPRPDAAASQWLEMPAQKVAFRMAQQRVHHQGLQFAAKDVIVRTQGSVGLDQSLSLVAEVPIRDEWVTKDRYLASLQGQVLQLPIHGTLKQPRVDGQALTQLTQQAVTGAATRLLEQELNRGLQRLLQPRQP